MAEVRGYQRFFADMKRRRVFRVMAVYGAVGFVLLQVVELLIPALLLPEWTYRLIALLLIVGFPIAGVLAWAFESTPDGVRRTDPAATGELEAIAAQPASRRWPAGLLALAGVAALLAGVWLAGREAGESRAAASVEVNGKLPVDPAGASDDAVLQLAYADLSDDVRPSIAVLPFADMSQAGDQEYFADGMTEELLNALAKIRELRVAGRTSSFAYKGEDKDLRQIGDELGVRYLVEGSVRKQEDRLRITAQLVDAKSSFHLWSETYDRTIEDIFAVQEEISESIAEALEVSLGLSEDQALVIPTADLDAYDLYLAGQARMRERREGVEEAVRLFGAAVARDSVYAPAWSGLAQAQALVPYYVDSSTPPDSALWATSLANAERAARRALELDPFDAGAEVALANVIRDRWEWDSAEPHYLRALEIDPDNVEAHQQYAEFLAATGRLDEALRSARRGAELDPTSAIRLFVLGYVLGENGRHEEAIVVLNKAIQLDPSLLRSQWELFDNLMDLGEWDRARDQVMEVIVPIRLEQGFISAETLADIEREAPLYFSAMRNRNGAELEACCKGPISPWDYALIGDMERALEALTALLGSDPGYGTNWQVNLWNAQWDGVRSDPSFQAVARQMGLGGVEPRRVPPDS